MSELPTKLLKDCCSIVSGSTPSRKISEYWGGDIAWATPKDLSKLDISELIDTPEHITEEGLRSCSTSLLPPGSVLFSSRAPIGLVAIAGREMCTNQGFKSLIPRPEIDSRYLYWCMRHMAPRIDAMGNGAIYKEVSKSVMERVEIPVPESLPEQKRIAAILDQADAIRRKRAQALTLADTFLKSAFLNMFGDPVTNPKNWPTGTIRDLLSEAKYGSSGKAGHEGEYAMIRMNNITYDGGWDFTDLKYIDLVAKDVEKYTVRRGDILFNRTNSAEMVGKTAVYDRDGPMAYAGYLVRGRTNDRALPEYISGYMNSDHGKATLRHMCKSIIGMANINAQEFQDITIMIPPIAVQQKYVQLVNQTRCYKSHGTATLEEADHLFNSLTQRAFQGEL